VFARRWRSLRADACGVTQAQDRGQGVPVTNAHTTAGRCRRGKSKTSSIYWSIGLLASSCLGLYGCHEARPAAAAAPAAPAAGGDSALTVSLTSPVSKPWSDRITAIGNIEPWQLMSIGAEVSGVRVTEVLAEVGDPVRKGQLLARLDDAAIRVDLSVQQAALAEAKANLSQAQVSLGRAKKLTEIEAVSRQDLMQAETTATTSAARVAMAEAQVKALELKLQNTRIIAPDDGTVSARNASIGALVDGSSELFKLIRNGRIEWRAELRPEYQARVEIGQAVQLRDPLGHSVEGKVRQIAPTADPTSRVSLVYVDVSPDKLLKPGVLATGELQLSNRMALTVPHASLVLRDGFSYAMTVDHDGLVKPIKVQIGEQRGNDVEILSGLAPNDNIIASGVGFLHGGDRVRVVQSPGGRPAVARAGTSVVEKAETP